MPQLDPVFFPSQIFWLAVVFGGLYFFLAWRALPSLERVFAERRKLTSGRREAAAKAAEESRAAMERYESALASAREEARAEAMALRQNARAEAQARDKEAYQRLEKRISEAEARIGAALAASGEEAAKAAALAAAELVERLSGVTLNPAEARAAVEQQAER